MIGLRTKPGTSTKDQHRTLAIEAKRRGIDLDAIRETCGGSIRSLSVSACSDLIRRISGRGLPNAPGCKPAPYRRRRRPTSATRMIATDHAEQIERLLLKHFGDADAGSAWLQKDFEARTPRDLLTARRAGQVIRVLKDMIARREAGSDTAPCRRD